jgi:hypothetical protein
MGATTKGNTMSNNGTIVVDPRAGNVSGMSNVAEYEVKAYHPNGDQGILKIRVGNDKSATADEEQENFMLTIDPASLTSGLERDLAQLDAKLADFSGYDREGKPIMRYTGRERELLEYKYGNRRHALIHAQQTRAQAERLQADAKKARAVAEQRIEQAAQVQAQKLIEEAEVARRAKQIAARHGVND